MIRESAEQLSDADGAPGQLSARAAAALLKVNERTIRRAIARGELAAIKSGKSYRIALADLHRYAERDSQAVGPPAPPHLVVLPQAEAIAAMPTPLSSFIGRHDEVAAVSTLLRDPGVRLLTLTGPGGIGKTRLALAAAASVADVFGDGSVFVGLATVDRAELVLPEIGRAFGLHDTHDRSLHARVRAYLRTKRLLLLLDNFEQVLATAPLVADLAAYALDITILTTSRAPLRLSGEREFPVPPLALPDSGRATTEAGLLGSDAARLFLERARERDPLFTVDHTTAPVIAEVCIRLDGLPLAVELAAAQAKLMSPRQLLTQLAPSLPYLTAGPRDAPERQRTLRNTIAWSYDLLTSAEQALFRRLSVFVGGFTPDAATWVTTWQGTGEAGTKSAAASASVLALLGSLLDQSLLVRVIGPDDQPRFRMLETVREFGLEQLATLDESAPAAMAHAHYFLHIARSLQPAVLVRATRDPLDRLAADHANLLAALNWFDTAGSAADFVALVAVLPSFWRACSRHEEGRDWLRRALVKSDAATPVDQARIHVGLAGLLTLQGNLAEADSLLAVGLPLLRSCATPLDMCEALVWAGAKENFSLNFVAADSLLHEAMSLAEFVDEPVGRAAVTANALANRGVSAQGLGELERAVAHHQAALQLYQRHDLDLGISRSLADLGEVARARGDARTAYDYYAAALSRADDVRDMRVIAESLIGVGRFAAARGQVRPATLLLAAAEAMREQYGTGVLFEEDDEFLSQAVQMLRQSLGDANFASVWAEGRTLSRADAVAVAMLVGETAVPTAQESGVYESTAFTARELDVLRLLVTRRTTREIADELFLSPRTVQWYISTILSKLGASSRREAAARAAAAGLV